MCATVFGDDARLLFELASRRLPRCFARLDVPFGELPPGDGIAHRRRMDQEVRRSRAGSKPERDHPSRVFVEVSHYRAIPFLSPPCGEGSRESAEASAGRRKRKNPYARHGLR